MSNFFKKIIPGKKKKKKEKDTKKKEEKKTEKKPAKQKTAAGEKTQIASAGRYTGKSVLKEPLVTEKSRNMSMDNKYVFKIKLSANKSEVKKEVEKRYGVTVKKLNIIKKKIRPRQFRGQPGRKKIQKKAVVTLKEGDKIEIFPV